MISTELFAKAFYLLLCQRNKNYYFTPFKMQELCFAAQISYILKNNEILLDETFTSDKTFRDVYCQKISECIYEEFAKLSAPFFFYTDYNFLPLVEKELSKIPNDVKEIVNEYVFPFLSWTSPELLKYIRKYNDDNRILIPQSLLEILSPEKEE